MPAVLEKIKPLNVDIIPPVGAKFYGHTPTGLPIYEQEITRAGKPEPVLDEDGKQVWELHPTTAKPMYPRWKKRPVTRTRFIIPNQQGNGNLSWDEWVPPSEGELAEAKRRQAIEAAAQALPALLVDAGITPEELIAAVRERRSAAPASSVAPPPLAEASPYPQHLGGPRWKLSDGSVFTGKKVDAIAADEALPAEVRTAAKEALARSKEGSQGLSEE